MILGEIVSQEGILSLIATEHHILKLSKSESSNFIIYTPPFLALNQNMIINNKFTRYITLERLYSHESMANFHILSKSTKTTSCKTTLNIPRGVIIEAVHRRLTDNEMTMKKRNDDKPNSGPQSTAQNTLRLSSTTSTVNREWTLVFRNGTQFMLY